MQEVTGPIAVVIPGYNGERYFAQTLDSITTQILRPAHVIVADDRPTDGTCEMVRRYQSEATLPLTLLELPWNSGGRARPLNRAIEPTDAADIAVVEQDDLLHPSRLRRQFLPLGVVATGMSSIAGLMR